MADAKNKWEHQTQLVDMMVWGEMGFLKIRKLLHLSTLPSFLNKNKKEVNQFQSSVKIILFFNAMYRPNFLVSEVGKLTWTYLLFF